MGWCGGKEWGRGHYGIQNNGSPDHRHANSQTSFAPKIWINLLSSRTVASLKWKNEKIKLIYDNPQMKLSNILDKSKYGKNYFHKDFELKLNFSNEATL